MRLLCCCVVIAFHCVTANAAVDIERTVRHVESILQANSQLPRLTREEIMQLLNDIKAEDAKTNQIPVEPPKEDKVQPYLSPVYINERDQNVNAFTKIPEINQNDFSVGNKFAVSASTTTENNLESTTKSSEPSVMVVLPYTPRDGSSLQELYTKPPRVEVLPLSRVTPKTVTAPSHETDAQKHLERALVGLSKATSNSKNILPPELESFLNAHGFKNQNGQDHFLLPLDGFKPLPPGRVVDGSVELPENILLTYDLISPSSQQTSSQEAPGSYPQTNYLYDPLQPDFPFELDTSSSEKRKTMLPLDMPKSRKTKSSKSETKPSYKPIDYDSVKVIPLNKGPNPLEDSKEESTNDVSKRQTDSNETISNDDSSSPSLETTTVSSDSKAEPITNAPAEPDSSAAAADNDSGASISDLADSFGGAAPVKPGDSELPPPRKNGFYWMVDWNSFLEVGDGDSKVNIRFEPKLGDPHMFIAAKR